MAGRHTKHRKRRGFALITTGVCSIAMLGMLGLVVDVGRLYVVKSEMQAYADSTSLAAAVELDGTDAGITRALNVVAASTNRWNLGTATFSGTQTDFAAGSSGPWQSSPSPAAGVRFARVRASGSVPLYFLPAAAAPGSSSLSAAAVAGQALQQDLPEDRSPFRQGAGKQRTYLVRRAP